MKRVLIILVLIFINSNLFAQEEIFIPNLKKHDDASIWTISNRGSSYDEGLHLDAKPGDGLIWLKDHVYDDCVLELEIKGKNEPGRSFVGVAFHIENDSTFDAVYFRAFNFQNSERDNHSVQYISHPEFTWRKLRTDHPGKYENKVDPVPDPNSWFKVSIHINYPEVKVYVKDNEKPSLQVEQISKRASGGVGLWVGNNSEGSFRNLKIIKE